MTNRFAVGGRDLNEPLIIAVLLRAGIGYIQLREGDGADLIVKMNPLFFVEIKNPAQPPSRRRLTPDELRLQAECGKIGVAYFVIETPEEMARIVNVRRAPGRCGVCGGTEGNHHLAKHIFAERDNHA